MAVLLNPVRIDTLRRLERQSGESLVGELLSTFRQDLISLPSWLDELAGEDRERWNQLTHLHRGRALSLGAERLATILNQAEKLESAEWPGQCRSLIELVAREIDGLMPVLDEILGGEKASTEPASPSEAEPGRAHPVPGSTIAPELLPMLARAIETMSFGLTITDNEGRIVLANSADAEMHGFGPGELSERSSSLLGLSRSESLFPDPIPQPWVRETMNRHRDGSLFPVRLTSDLVVDSGGEPLGMVTLCEDIREEVERRETLARKDRILAAVGRVAATLLGNRDWEEAVPEILTILAMATARDRIALIHWAAPSGNGICFLRNGLHMRQRPMSRSDLVLPKTWSRTLDSGIGLRVSLEEADDEKARWMANFDASHGELLPIFSGEERRGLLFVGGRERRSPLSEAERVALRAVVSALGGAMRRREHEKALEMTRADIDSFLRNTSDLFQVTQADGRLLSTNEAWRNRLGYSGEEIGDLALADFVDPEYLEGFRTIQEQALAGQEPQPFKTCFLTRTGERRLLEGTITADRSQDGASHLRALLRDVTGTVEIEAMKDDFIERISHELRTPLSSVLGSLRLLLRGSVDLPDRRAELLAMALRQSESLDKLIASLLEFSQISAGGLDLRVGPVEVADILREQRQRALGEAEGRRVELEISLPDGSFQALADPQRLGQILHVLISNAIRFSPRDGRVVLDAAIVGNRSILGVNDDGPGIPAELRAGVFERFSQVGRSTTRSHSGMGLGLSFARALVRQMEGELELDTQRQNGSRFVVSLPLA